MKKKFGFEHKSDYNHKAQLTEFKGATKEQFEKKHTIPDQAVPVKDLIKRINDGRPKAIEPK